MATDLDARSVAITFEGEDVDEKAKMWVAKIAEPRFLDWEEAVDVELITTPNWITQYQANQQKQALALEQYMAVVKFDTMYRTDAPVTDVPELTSELFEGAAEHLKAHGWTQKEDVGIDGHVCARGALVRATRGSGLFDRFDQKYNTGTLILMANRMVEIMDLMGIDTSKYTDVMSWNDEAGRTADEVLDALMGAAKKLRDLGR